MNKIKILLNSSQLDRVLKKILHENVNTYRELSEEEENNAFAAFVVVKLANGKIAATTRPYEKDKNKKIGLPGGRVESGETPKDTANRESKEEGWKISKIGKIIASQMVDGNPIVFFEGHGAKKLDDYLEKDNNIKPISVSIDKISNTGYKNSFIKELFSENTDTDMKEQTDLSSEPSTAQNSGSEGYPQVGKWESGITRGPANQLGVTKWSDIVGQTLKRGHANPLK